MSSSTACSSSRSELFDLPESGARFSACRRYRYELWRRWDCRLPSICFIMLNPSTASEAANDPTVTRCQERARRLGYGSLFVGNIFAFRSTDPKLLYMESDPIGHDNDAAILSMALRSELVICGWGGHGDLRGRGKAVEKLLGNAGIDMRALKLNANGTPAHPLYLSYSLPPIPMP